MRHYCTLFDINYLAKGLALIASLERHDPAFVLHILCLDEAVHRYFAVHPSPRVRTLTLQELEQGDDALLAAKENRSRIEYYFTLSPTLPLRILERNPEIDQITYLDADLYFFANPQAIFDEMGAASILAIGHRFPDHLKDREKNGLYNVGFLSFKRDPNGLACLTWWRERCNEWCYDIVEPDRFADQKYLDHWPRIFSGVHILRQNGAGLAPWNLLNHRIESGARGLLVDGDPLIFYHFHNFSLLTPSIALPGTGFYWPASLPPLLRQEIFLPYVTELRRILRAEPAARNVFNRYQKQGRLRFLSGFLLDPPKLLHRKDRLIPIPVLIDRPLWRNRVGRPLRKAMNWIAAPFKRLRNRPEGQARPH